MLQSTGTQTRLCESIRTILRQKQTGLQAVVLLTDGRSTDGTPNENLAALAQSSGTPVYAMPLGGNVTPPDLSITVPQPRRAAFTDQPHPITITCRAEGLPALRTDLTVYDQDRTIVTNIPVQLSDNTPLPVSFTITPHHTGCQRYSAELAAQPDEKRLANNQASFTITTLTNAIRILLAEGTPYWDSKFLARFLRNQPQFSVTAVYHITPEKHLVLLPDSEEPIHTKDWHFPDTPEEIAHYDLVIFGKNCDAFLNPKRIELLKNAISDQGLGLIFARSKPYEGLNPELARLEPVNWGPPINHPFSFIPCSDNSLFGDSLPAPDSRLWQNFPALNNACKITGQKAFAQVLAEGRPAAGEQKDFPVLIYRRYGHGLILTMNAEGFWHWDFFPADVQSRDIYRDIWSQLLLWVATHSEFLPGRDFALELSSVITDPGEAVAVRVTSRAAPNDMIDPLINIRNNQQLVQTIPLTANPDTANRWTAIFVPDTPGIYQLELADTFEMIPPGITRILQVSAPPSEFDNLSADPETLRTFCEATGGNIILREHWDELITTLDTPQQKKSKGKAVWTPYWDSPLLFFLIMLLFSAEWFLRRRNGLL